MTSTDRSSVRRPWLAAALLGALACVCIALGFWQLGRAEQSKATAERIEAARDLPAVGDGTDGTDGTDQASLEALRYRTLEVQGRYVPERQFLLDNIVHDGAVGYYVLTPFAPANGGPWLLVNRGWVEADFDRRVLPDVEVESSERRIEGRVDALPSAGLRLGREPVGASDTPVRVLTYPTVAELEASLGRPLLGYQLQLDASQPDGFVRDFPGPAFGAERHLGYAAQWWLFASIAGGAAGVIGWREMRRRNG